MGFRRGNGKKWDLGRKRDKNGEKIEFSRGNGETWDWGGKKGKNWIEEREFGLKRENRKEMGFRKINGKNGD